MQTNANTRVEIKKVLIRKYDRLKFVIIPKKSDIEAGDFVLIKKIESEATSNVQSSKH